MFYVNKVAGWLLSPLGFALLGLVATAAVSVFRFRWLAKLGLAVVFFWLLAWSTPLMTLVVGAPLESAYLKDGRVPSVADAPSADVIVLFGGGMGVNTNASDFAEMSMSADRVWHAARLWKAGKAPRILATGCDVRLSTGELLSDFGVPTNAVFFLEGTRNTEEEARGLAAWCVSNGVASSSAKAKVLAVTSAWHMDRVRLMLAKYAPQVEGTPAPSDFEATTRTRGLSFFGLLLPTAESFAVNSAFVREHLGSWGYRTLRGRSGF